MNTVCAKGLACGWQSLLAAAEPGTRRSLASLYAVAAAWTLSAWRFWPAQAADVSWLAFLILAMLAWLLWMPRLVVVARELQQLQAPGSLRGMWLGLLLAWGVSVLLPAALLLLLGVPMLKSLAALSLVAVLCLWLGLLPGVVLLGLCLLPGLLEGSTSFDAKVFFTYLGAAPAPMALLALMLALPLILHIHRLTRPAKSWPNTAWRQPLVLQLDALMQQSATRKGNHGMMSYAPSTARFGSVQHTLRTWLGAPFAPMPWRQRLLHIGMLLFTLLAWPLLMALVIDDKPHLPLFFFLNWGILMLMFVVVYAFPANLAQRRFHDDAEFTELALLPGMGASKPALLRAVFVPLAVTVLAPLLLLMMAAPFVHLPAPLYLAIPGMMALAAALCLRILRGQKGGWVIWPLAALYALLVVASTLLSVERLPAMLPAQFALWLSLAWLALILASTTLAWRAWRGYWQLPHPFLRY